MACVQLSFGIINSIEAAKAALKNKPAETAEPLESDPVIYRSTGEIAAAPVEPESTVSFSA